MIKCVKCGKLIDKKKESYMMVGTKKYCMECGIKQK